MLPVVLALLIYTISLRLTVNTCFLQVKHSPRRSILHDLRFPKGYPALSRFLHVVPLLGTFCMASVELVLDMQSPALAAIVLLLSVLPFITIVVHHGRQCDGTPLPIRMQDAPTVSGSSDITVMVNTEVRPGQAV